MMDHKLIIFGLWSLLVVFTRADPPDNLATIVELIEGADRLVLEGNHQKAASEYQRARGELMRLHELQPNWEPEAVSNRLDYLEGRLGNLLQPVAAAAETDVPAQQHLQNRINYLERANAQYQQQLNQLLSENAKLATRLREALAIRPASQDPARLKWTQDALASATNQIGSLTKRLTELEEKLAAIPDEREARDNFKILKETRKNLTLAMEDAGRLRQENDQLRRLLSTGSQEQANQPSPVPAGQDLVAQGSLQAAQTELIDLRQQNLDLKAQLAAAMAASGQGTKTDPATGRIRRVDAARMALAENRLDAAETELLQGLKSDPEDAELLYLLGCTLNLKGDYVRAEEPLQRAIRILPDSGVAHFELARVQLERTPSDPGLARWHYNKAINLGYPRDSRFEKRIDWESPNDAN